MKTIAIVLYLVGVLPTLAGVVIVIGLAPRPKRLLDHLLGLARILIVGGVAFKAAQLGAGWVPDWPDVTLQLGLGLAMGIYARENNLVALAHEKLDKVLGESH